MSLLATATEWKNDDEQPKKRTPTIGLRKPKPKPVASSASLDMSDFTFSSSDADEVGAASPIQLQHNSIENVLKYNEARNDRINKVIESMYLKPENVGEKLADFNPIPRPSLMKGDSGMYPSTTDAKTTKPPSSTEAFSVPANPLQHPPPQINRNYSGLSPLPNVGYTPNNSGKYTHNNINRVFGGTQQYGGGGMGNNAPYYAKMGMGKGDVNDKLLEKINYMIHLLEEQQLEKTNNVMEEFILYSLLGVFMIYVMDSFARAGKYMR